MFERFQLNRIDSPSPEKRRKAARILRTWKDPRAVPALQKLLTDQDNLVKKDAILGLTERGLADVHVRIAKLDHYGRHTAALTYANWKDPRAVEGLQNLVSDEHLHIRGEAAFGLIERGIADLRCCKVALDWMANCNWGKTPPSYFMDWGMVPLKVILAQPDVELRNSVLEAVHKRRDRDFHFATLLSNKDEHAAKALETFCKDETIIANIRSRSKEISELWVFEPYKRTVKLSKKDEEREQTLGAYIANAGFLLWLCGGTAAHEGKGNGKWLSYNLPRGYDGAWSQELVTCQQRAQFFLAASGRD
jgi:hypothetical protein